jgi:predicted nicotinamide N-methyase
MVSLLRIRYQTVEFGDVDIHVRTLRDHMQYLDVDGIAENLGISSATWPIFGVIWASGRVLAHHMAEFKIAGKKILEVGCGIGLASLVLNHRRADITATDYHPEAEAFLKENVLLNKGKKIPFFRMGWADEDGNLGRFDLVIGSDLLYERGHAGLLSQFIEQHANPHCEVILVDPGRGNQGRFTKHMAELGYVGSRNTPENPACDDLSFKGRILTYLR